MGPEGKNGSYRTDGLDGLDGVDGNPASTSIVTDLIGPGHAIAEHDDGEAIKIVTTLFLA